MGPSIEDLKVFGGVTAALVIVNHKRSFSDTFIADILCYKHKLGNTLVKV